MKNYFYGINVNARSHFNNVAEKSILFGNNYNHVKNAVGGAQSVTNTQNLYFNALDPNLTGTSRQNAINSRLNDLQEVTGNNPNIKIDREAFNAIASGDEVSLKLQLEAPERRNLFIGLSIAASQLIGGLAGAAYSQQLGAFDIQRAQEDAGFVTEHGNNYKLNPFGGAEVQQGRISVASINHPKPNDPADPIAKPIEVKSQTAVFDAITTEKARKANLQSQQRQLEIDTVRRAQAYKGPLSVANHDDTSITGPVSIARAFSEGDPKDKPVTSKGNRANGTVDGIHVTAAGVTSINNPLVERAVKQYLNAVSLDSDVLSAIQDPKLRGALVSTADAGKKGTELLDVFHAQEKGLQAFTGNKADSRIGGQHTVNEQKTANDLIKVFTDSNQNISKAINGTGVISEQTAALFRLANKDNAELRGLSAADIQGRINTGDLRGLSETISFNSAQAEKKAGDIDGKYGKNNIILQQTLGKLPELKAQGVALQGLIADRQSGRLQNIGAEIKSGNQNFTVTDSTGTQKPAKLNDAVKSLEADFKSGNLDKGSQDQVIKELGSSLAQQLNLNGIKQADGTKFTQTEALDLAKRIGNGDTNGIDPKILNNTSLFAHLTSVGSLIKSAESTPSVAPSAPSANNGKIAGVFSSETSDFRNALKGLVAQSGNKGAFSDADIDAVAKAKTRAELTEPGQQALFDSVAANANLRTAFTAFNTFTEAAGKANKDVASAISAPSAATNDAATKSVGDANTAATAFAGSVKIVEDALGIKANAGSVSDARRSASSPANPGEQVGGVAATTSSAPATTPAGNTPAPEPAKPPVDHTNDPKTQLSERSRFSEESLDAVREAILGKNGQNVNNLTGEAKDAYRQVSGKADLNNTQKAIIEGAKAINQLTEKFTQEFFDIADKILKKAFTDFDYDYGFNSSTSNEAHSGSVTHQSLNETYGLAHQADQSISEGIKKFKQYDELRKTEALSNSRSVGDARKEFNSTYINSNEGKAAKIAEAAEDTKNKGTPVPESIGGVKATVNPAPVPGDPAVTSILTPDAVRRPTNPVEPRREEREVSSTGSSLA